MRVTGWADDDVGLFNSCETLAREVLIDDIPYMTNTGLLDHRGIPILAIMHPEPVGFFDFES